MASSHPWHFNTTDVLYSRLCTIYLSMLYTLKKPKIIFILQEQIFPFLGLLSAPLRIHVLTLLQPFFCLHCKTILEFKVRLLTSMLLNPWSILSSHRLGPLTSIWHSRSLPLPGYSLFSWLAAHPILLVVPLFTGCSFLSPRWFLFLPSSEWWRIPGLSAWPSFLSVLIPLAILSDILAFSYAVHQWFPAFPSGLRVPVGTQVRSCASFAWHSPMARHAARRKPKVLIMAFQTSSLPRSSWSSSPSHSLCCSHAGSLALPDTPGVLLPRGLCTSCSMFLECSSSVCPRSCLSHLLPAFAQMRPSPGGLHLAHGFDAVRFPPPALRSSLPCSSFHSTVIYLLLSLLLISSALTKQIHEDNNFYLFCSLMYPKYLEQCSAHIRCLSRSCGMNKSLSIPSDSGSFCVIFASKDVLVICKYGIKIT